MDDLFVITHLVVLEDHKLQDMLLFLIGSRKILVVSKLVVMVKVPIDAVSHHLFDFLQPRWRVFMLRHLVLGNHVLSDTLWHLCRDQANVSSVRKDQNFTFWVYII